MESHNIFISIIVIILIGTALIFREKKNYNQAPKRIWTYWDREDRIPKTVKMCIRGWVKWNPDYEIVLLTKKNYKGYVTIPEELTSHPNFNDTPARFSDLLRLWALVEHGGVWIDSSIILKGPLDDWLFPKYAEFSGFYMEGMTTKTPVIESWFFACNKGSPFVRKWRDEFSKIGQYPCVEQYVNYRKQMGVDIEKIKGPILGPIYLTIHVSAQKVLQLDQYPMDSMILRKAEDGPFRYLVDAKWDSEKAVRAACLDPSYQTPILKMRGPERSILEKGMEDEFSEEKCGWSS